MDGLPVWLAPVFPHPPSTPSTSPTKTPQSRKNQLNLTQLNSTPDLTCLDLARLSEMPHMLNYLPCPALPCPCPPAKPLVCSRSCATCREEEEAERGAVGLGGVAVDRCTSSTLTANRRSRSRLYATHHSSECGGKSGERGGALLLMLHIINLLCCCRLQPLAILCDAAIIVLRTRHSAILDSIFLAGLPYDAFMWLHL